MATPGLAQVAGPLGRGHHDGGGAVVLRAAVVEVERLGDPARGVVLLARQRRAVADRPRVALGVGVARQGDLGQRVLGDAVLVHEPHRLHRRRLGRREHPVRRGEGERAARAPHPPGLAVAAELALGERPEGDDALGVAGADRRVGERHRGAGAVAAAAERLRREVEVAGAEGGAQPDRFVAVHVRHEPVDVRRLQAGVVDGVADGDAGQLELGLRCLAAGVVRRLADPGDDGRAAHQTSKTRWALRPRILARASSLRPPIWRSIDCRRVRPRALVVRVVVGPHQVVDDVVLLGGVEADVILLERGEAVALEVVRRQVGDHRAHPHVVGLVGVVHRLQQPRHEADARLDEAGLQVRVALEHAGRDHLHERLDRRLHAVADVVDDRPAVAADGPRIAARRHVERERQPGPRR